MISLSKLEIDFWLEVARGALERTHFEIEVLTDTKYKKRVAKKMTEAKRKKLLAEKRMEETELTERVEHWESVKRIQFPKEGEEA